MATADLRQRSQRRSWVQLERLPGTVRRSLWKPFRVPRRAVAPQSDGQHQDGGRQCVQAEEDLGLATVHSPRTATPGGLSERGRLARVPSVDLSARHQAQV
uniref:(northern house mosquito) hypothetical protein n=1 Tax=Culex pipiens TaxID=7175 RepID=A0A8D8AE34_CULPI